MLVGKLYSINTEKKIIEPSIKYLRVALDSTHNRAVMISFENESSPNELTTITAFYNFSEGLYTAKLFEPDVEVYCDSYKAYPSLDFSKDILSRALNQSDNITTFKGTTRLQYIDEELYEFAVVNPY